MEDESVSSIVKPVDADAFACGRRQAVAERTNVIHIDCLADVVAASVRPGRETPFLFRRIIEFGKAVGNLHARHINLKRSVRDGSSGFCLDSGEISVGKS